MQYFNINNELKLFYFLTGGPIANKQGVKTLQFDWLTGR